MGIRGNPVFILVAPSKKPNYEPPKRIGAVDLRGPGPGLAVGLQRQAHALASESSRKSKAELVDGAAGSTRGVAFLGGSQTWSLRI